MMSIEELATRVAVLERAVADIEVDMEPPLAPPPERETRPRDRREKYRTGTPQPLAIGGPRRAK